MKNITVTQASEYWLNSLRPKIKKTTIANYEAWLFFFTSLYGQKSIKECDRWMLNGVVGGLKQRVDTREITVNTEYYYQSTLKRFLLWCLSEKFIDEDPTTDIEPKRPKPKRISKSMSPDVYRSIRQVVVNERDQAILDVMLLGLRPSEVVNLRWQDIDFDEMTAVVNGKVGERPIVLDEHVRDSLIKYKEWMAQHENPSPFVFVRYNVQKNFVRPGDIGPNGKPVDERLKIRTLRDVFTRLANRAGVGNARYRSPKSCRHLTGQKMREAGDALDAQGFLGHESLETTRIYTPSSNERLRSLMRQNNNALVRGASPPPSKEAPDPIGD